MFGIFDVSNKVRYLSFVLFLILVFAVMTQVAQAGSVTLEITNANASVSYETDWLELNTDKNLGNQYFNVLADTEGLNGTVYLETCFVDEDCDNTAYQVKTIQSASTSDVTNATYHYDPVMERFQKYRLSVPSSGLNGDGNATLRLSY